MPTAGPVRSMTGFASVEGTLRGRTYRAELKAVNHRFLELKVRLPRALSACEPATRQWLLKRVARGALDLKIEPVAGATQPSTEWRLNEEVLHYYCEEMRRLARSLGVTSEIRVSELMQLPDAVVRAGEDDAAESPVGAEELEPLLDTALAALVKMRETEGAALATALNRALDQLGGRAAALRSMRAEWSERAREQVARKVRAAFEQHPVGAHDPLSALEPRVAQELALLLERTDVEEELIRLEGHLTHSRDVISQGSPVGRKLEFLFQEMHREINTLANKAQDLGMSSEAVEAKILVEQLREQSLNVE